jgi:hypothetical protein
LRGFNYGTGDKAHDKACDKEKITRKIRKHHHLNGERMAVVPLMRGRPGPSWISVVP